MVYAIQPPHLEIVAPHEQGLVAYAGLGGSFLPECWHATCYMASSQNMNDPVSKGTVFMNTVSGGRHRAGSNMHSHSKLLAEPIGTA